MTQEKVNEIFETELGQQLDVIYVTSDDKVFIRYEEAALHTNELLNADPENFVDTSINEWYPESSHSPNKIIINHDEDIFSMKNLHRIPTENSSILSIKDGILQLHRQRWCIGTQHVYITNDEEIKVGDWYIYLGQINKRTRKNPKAEYPFPNYQKIIITTDQDLIKDGVQAIPDEFLQWFVKNPTCENVEVKKECCGQCDERLCEVYDREIGWTKTNTFYKISIPKNEETLEEAALSYKKHFGVRPNQFADEDFIAGVNWCKEQFEFKYRKKEFELELKQIEIFAEGYDAGYKKAGKKTYTKKEILKIMSDWFDYQIDEDVEIKLAFSEWFVKFKKK